MSRHNRNGSLPSGWPVAGGGRAAQADAQRRRTGSLAMQHWAF